MNNEKEFRIRNKQINFRVTEYEHNLILQQAKASGKKTLREYLIEVGTNINQIAHKVNNENRVYKADIEEIQEDIDLIWRMIRNAFYQIT